MITAKKIVLPCSEVFPLAGQLMEMGMRICFTVSGSSMWPLIRHNTDSVLLALPDRPVKVGDIVLTRFSGEPERYILHRVFRVTESSCITAGDNCIACDGPVPWSHVIGRVEKVYHGKCTIKCDALGWRFLFTVWRALFPFRRFLLRCLHLPGRVVGKLRSFK